MMSHSLLLRRPGVLGWVFAVYLAIATASGAAIYVLYQNVALAPIPVAEADRVVQFGPLLSTIEYDTILREGTSLTDVSAYVRRRVRMENADVVLLSDGLLVTPNYIPLMRLRSIQSAASNEPDNVIVVSTRLWGAIKGDKPFVTGTSISVEHQPYTVIGLLPGDYVGTALSFKPEFLIPIREIEPSRPPVQGLLLKYPMGGWLTVLARLQPGVVLDTASAEIKTLTKRDSNKQSSPNSPAFLEGLAEAAIPFNLRAPIKTTLRALFGLTVAIILITLINALVVAGFQILSRGREFLLRQTLGASPTQISRRLIGEYSLLGFVSGAAGVLVASIMMSRLTQVQITRFTSLNVSLGADIHTIVYSLVFATLVALIAATTWSRAIPRQDLGRVSASNGALPVRKHSIALGVAILLQLALSTTVAVPALFLVRSINNLTSVTLGFDRLNTVWARVDVGQSAAARVVERARLDETVKRLRALPSVDVVGMSSSVPLGWVRFVWNVVSTGVDRPVQLSGAAVDREYFAALSLSFVRGSSFSDPNSIVINATAAKQLFGNSEPVGETVNIEYVGERRIAGVVEDSRFFSVDEKPEAQMYLPIETDFPPSVAVIVRAKRSAESVLTDVRNLLSQSGRGTPPIELMTMRRHVDLYFGRARLIAIASVTLALLGVLISLVGTMVIGRFIVRARMHEAAVRLALGEQQLQLFCRMTFHGLGWGSAGVLIGIFTARQMVNLSASLLFGLAPTDTTTIVIALIVVMIALFVGVGTASIVVARMDPVDRLKVAV